jgi:hypothetical protein
MYVDNTEIYEKLQFFESATNYLFLKSYHLFLYFKI